MLLAALLDVGADAEAVERALSSLPVGGIRLEHSRVARHGIDAAHVDVVVEPGAEHHRTWTHIRAIIDESHLGDRAKALAQDAFRRLAEAEGRVHGIEPEEVHFHEVGAIDAIADVCGTAVAVEVLAPDRVVCSPLPASHGSVEAAHGLIPIPAPASLELLKGAPWRSVDVEAELVTPTGAALVAALADAYGPMPEMTPEAIGYGSGDRDLPELPGVVRVVMGAGTETAASGRLRPVSLLETNLDDMPSELVPDAAEACFGAGALDVWTAPIQMKKGRPGIVLSALARPDREEAVARALLLTTSTLGVRVSRLDRWELEREHVKVVIAGHPVRLKVGRLDERVVNVAPEHDDCVAVARATGQPVKEVWEKALRLFVSG
jgi:hypothetical protein